MFNLKARFREFIADAARSGCEDHRAQTGEMHKALSAHVNRVEDRITALVEAAEVPLSNLKVEQDRHFDRMHQKFDEVFTSTRRICKACGNLAHRFFVGADGVTCHDCMLRKEAK